MDLRRITEIDLHRCFKALRRGKLFILLLTVLGTLCGAALALFSVSENNIYDAQASVYSIASGSYEDSQLGTAAIRTYSTIIKSYKVAERAVLLLGDDSVTQQEMYDMIEVDSLITEGTTYVYENTTSVITIHAKNTDAELAMRAVNAVADAFVLEVNSMASTDAAQVLDYAHGTTTTYNAKQTQMLAVIAGAVFGFLIASCWILARTIFSTKIVSVQDAALHGELKVVGVIPKF